MKTLTVEINEVDFEKYALEKIKPALNNTTTKAKFKDTPAYNL